MTQGHGARIEIEPMRIYDYDIAMRAGGATPKKQEAFPSEFIISEKHRGALKDQGEIGACVACVMSTLAEVLNVIEQEKDNSFEVEDMEFSEGWAYGALRTSSDWMYGMYPSIALKEWSKKGIVPKKYFNVLEEMPEMKKKTEAIPSLNKTAELYKIKGYASLKKNTAEETDRAIKQALMDNDYGLLAVSNKYFSESHCIMLVGWNDKNNTYKIKNSWGTVWGDKEGIGEIPKSAINAAFVITDEILDINFIDVTTQDWFYKYVKDMYLSGIMTGVTETTFEPLRSITRAEVVTIISRLVDLTNDRIKTFLEVLSQKNDKNYTKINSYLNVIPEDLKLPFTDVQTEDWFYQSVRTAYGLNIIKGKTETEFYPNDNITRAEIAMIIKRFCTLVKNKFKKVLESNINKSIYNVNISKIFNYKYISHLPFIDLNTEDWFYEPVLDLYTLGIMSGVTNNTFEPNKDITRAETATVIDRLAKYIDSIIQTMLEN